MGLIDAAVNYQALSFWWNVFLTLCLVVMGVYQWIRGRHHANATDIRLLRDEIHALVAQSDEKYHQLESRIRLVEHDLSRQPTRADLQTMSDRIGIVHADLKQVVGSLNGVQRAVDLMNQHLLERGSR